MGLRTELVQVAAVAVAMVEDLVGGSASGTPTSLGYALWQVRKEREAQNRKWGAQHHEMADWLAILLEEVGEAAAEVVVFEGPQAKRLGMLQTHVLELGFQARKYLKEVHGQ